MSLTRCFARMGKNLSRENRAAISQLAAEFRREGMDNKEAAKAAVREHDKALAALADDFRANPEKAAPAPGGEKQEGQAAVERAAQEIEAMNPDMLVHMEGMDAPMRVGDIMARIREEAAQDVKDGKLLEVAAECSLTA